MRPPTFADPGDARLARTVAVIFITATVKLARQPCAADRGLANGLAAALPTTLLSAELSQ
jgi:hypothetical protein